MAKKYLDERGQFTEPAGGSGTVTSDQITDATTVGKSVLTAADAAAARTAIGAVAIGTTGTTAMAGNKTPTTTDRGGVLQQTAIADLAAAPTQQDINGILAKLRASGLLAT